MLLITCVLAPYAMFAAWLKWKYFHAVDTGFGSLIGDYGPDADYALVLALRGDPLGMYGTSPAPLMMPLALLVRLPALAVGHLVGLVELDGASLRRGRVFPAALDVRYAVGTVSVFAAGGLLALVGAWQAGRAARVTAVVFALALMFGPVSDEVIRFGHPEEFLGAATAFAALCLLARGKHTAAAVCVGLALAVKQPLWLTFPAFVLAYPVGARVRLTAITVGVAALLIVPFVLPHLASIVGEQAVQVGSAGKEHKLVTNFWAATGLKEYGALARPLIVLFALLLPVLFASRKRAWVLTPLMAGGVISMVLVVRCAFDPYNIVYYAMPAVGAMLATEWAAWNAGVHPLRRVGALQRLNVGVPVFSLLAGGALDGASGGFITHFVTDQHLGNNHGRVYVLVAFVVLCALTPVALGASMRMSRERRLLYGTAVAAAVGLLAAVSVFGQQTTKRDLLPPPPGFTAESNALIAQRAAPVTAFWLGEADIGGTYLRTRAVRKTTNLTTNVALFDYGQTEGAASITVFTRDAASRRPLRAALAACKSGSCAGARQMVTPAGPALVTTFTSGAWQARVLTASSTLYVLADPGIATPPQALARLQALTAR